MGKIIEAECSNEQIKINGFGVEGSINSKGIGESEGYAFLDEGRVVYFPNQSSDLEDILDKIDAILSNVVTVLTGLDGATNSPGAQTANIAQVSAAQAELAAIKGVLR